MTPTLEQLAIEVARRDNRCAHVERDRICLRMERHQGEHEYKSFRYVIPFE